MAKNSKGILIATGIATLIVVTTLIIFRSTRKIIKTRSFSQRKLNAAITTIPDTKFNKYDIIIVFGGLHYATPNWMLTQMNKQTPDLLLSNIVIFLPYSYSQAQTMDTIAKSSEGRKINSMSIIGFSKGGENVVNLKNTRRWRFVGLIDPAIGWNFDSKTWGKETRMTYGSSAMMKIYESNGSRYTNLSNLIHKGGGKSERTVTDHKLAPEQFFKRFEKQINYGN